MAGTDPPKSQPNTSSLALLSEFEVTDPAFQQIPTWKEAHLNGWRFGITVCAASALAVLLVNTTILLWAEAKNGWLGFSGDGKRVLYDGSCERTKNLNIGVHLLINILSTILLGASNYCMQCMSAPTRTEVDRAHSRGQWLDIGVQSLRNLNKIARKRVLLYLVLGFSSLPLHLFYNSTVFSSIAANEYSVFSANEIFANPRTQNFTENGRPPSDEEGPSAAAVKLFDKARNGLLDRLEPAACLNEYAISFQTSRGNLVLVVPDTADGFGGDNATLWFENGEDLPTVDSGVSRCLPYAWICNTLEGRGCETPCELLVGSIRNNISSWRPFHKDILYCLSEPIEQHCRLMYSVQLATIIVLLNAFKAAVMLYLGLGAKWSPLVTMGDAISSFLQRPDPTTEGMCLISKLDVKKHHQYGKRFSPATKYYTAAIRTRFAAASRLRWSICIVLFTAAIGICCIFLGVGIASITGPKDPKTLFGMGLGAINPRTFIRWEIASSGAAGIILNVLVANVPQVVLSLLYFSYNGLFTCMSLATEWSDRANHRKGLRVSSAPRGAQRSTYFLQLPYRFAVPLMLTSGTLHWLVSQSIFLVSVDAYTTLGNEERRHLPESDYMTCGFSPVAIIAVILIGVFMVLAALISGSVKLESGMPVAGSCSAAISAACHPKNDDRDMAFSGVQWGALPSFEGEVGHCSFTSSETVPPREGGLYAGPVSVKVTRTREAINLLEVSKELSVS